jgi:acyl transferase domain-containing protein
MTQNLARHFREHPDIQLADAAYTLQVGRQVFSHRGMLVCPGDYREAADLLSQKPGKIMTYKSSEDNRPIVFLFPGLGSQYVNMGRDLYEQETIFREEMNRCFEILEPLLDYDIKEILYPPHSDCRSGSQDTPKNDPGQGSGDSPLERGAPKGRGVLPLINQPGISQVVTFIFEYALAQLLIQWGIKPYAMMGYSFGEYTAACISGVFSLTDALKLVVARGRLLQQAPEGVMLSVPLSRAELDPYLAGNKEISLAIDNGISCVIAGSPPAVDLLAKQMKQKRIMCMPVPAERALHSHMMEPILEKFAAIFDTITLDKPQIPYISNVTGHWQTDEQAADPAYWARHLRETVRFAAGMKTLLKEPGVIFVEIGPGRDISTLALRYLESDPQAEHRVLNLVRPPHQDISDIYFLLNRVGRLWLVGQPIDWSGFHGEQKSLRKRIPLPTYPFEKHIYMVEETSNQWDEILTTLQEESRPIPGFADWFYFPTWTHHVLLPPLPSLSRDNDDQPPPYHWLVFMDGCGLGQSVVKRLKEKNHGIITLEPGREFVRTGPGSYIIDPGQEDDYQRLFKELAARPTFPTRVLHLWGVTGTSAGTGDMEEFEKIQETGFYSLLYTAKALGKEKFKKQIQIDVVTDQMQEVTGEEPLCPAKAAIIGPVRVIPQEFPGVRCRSIDVILPPPGDPGSGSKVKKLLEQLMEEILTETYEPVIAFRGSSRWVRTFQPLRL